MTNQTHSSHGWWDETEAIPLNAHGNFGVVLDPGGLVPSGYHNYYQDQGLGLSDLSGAQPFGFAPGPSYADSAATDIDLATWYDACMGGPADNQPTSMDRDH